MEAYPLYGHMPPLIASSSSERLPVVSPVGSDSDDSWTSSSSDDVGPPPLLHVGDVGDSSSSEDERHPLHLEHFCHLSEWLGVEKRDIVGFVGRNGSMVGPFMLTCGDAKRVRPLARSTSSDLFLCSRTKYIAAKNPRRGPEKWCLAFMESSGRWSRDR